jgi:soluble lytic murein transglycosylase-like protein
MVYPSGIDAATQRIEEIQQRMAALDNTPQAPLPNSQANVFGQILNGQLQPNSPNQAAMEQVVENEAQKVNLDPNLAKAVAKTESGFNPNAVSSAGAQGLMQLMPETASGLGVKAILDPTENAQGGTRYLKSLLDKYHSVPNALAAYNAGPGAVDKYGGVPPYKETQNYVQRVLQSDHQYEQQSMEAN